MHLNGRFSSEQELHEKLDFIYEKSKCGGSFHGILEVASNEVTIITAIHNIKANGGANTAGIDKVRMDKYLHMGKGRLVETVQAAFRQYKPKPAKLNPGHYHCHHINPSLPIIKINKVSNLAWVCESCHSAIHGKGLPDYATGSIRHKIEKFQKQLESYSF